MTGGGLLRRASKTGSIWRVIGPVEVERKLREAGELLWLLERPRELEP